MSFAENKIENEYVYGLTESEWGLFHYKYDDKNNIIERYPKTSGSFSLYTEKYKYNEVGNLIERNTTSRSLPVQIISSKYDDTGNLIEDFCYNGLIGKMIYNEEKYQNYDSKWSYQYDDKRNLIKEVFYSRRNNIKIEKKYKYIMFGKKNWLKKIEFKDNKEHIIFERNIEYF